ncbi:MFS transporter [Streptomyces muensis]|uniref:MFS transporter n=1 Tax=Streptomyces muensis TaxID=1077944 RepID=A0A9X1PV78_STRM4|nr:MFS transporter [Streptomyces muensis]MCF1592323.1 MFS transporter [Streptomyces muensis]
MSNSTPPSESSGLGAEAVDESTRIAEVDIDQAAERKVAELQKRGMVFWVLMAAVVVLLAEQTSFSFGLYSFALGSFAAEYPGSNVVWIMTGLMLGQAVVIPLLTKLGDVYGKKKIIVWSVAILCVGCLVCAVAPNFTVLIIGRVLMSGCGGLVMLVLALVREVFPVRMRATVFSIVSTGGGLIIIGGPMMSAWLTEHVSLESTFWAQLGMAAVAGIIALIALPETPIRVRAGVDYIGAFLLGLGAFGVVGALSQVQTRGWDALTIGGTAGGAVALLVWMMYSSRIKEPLINLALIGRRAMAVTIVAMGLIVGGTAIMQVLAVLAWSTPPAAAGYGQGLDQLHVAYWSIPYAILWVGSGVFVGLTVKSIGYRLHVIWGAVILAISTLLLGFTLEASDAVIIAVYSLGGFASMAAVAAVALVMLAAPEDQRAVALGVNQSVTSIAVAITGQIAYAILEASKKPVGGGVEMFQSGGFKIAYIVAAGFAIVGGIVAVFIPHGRRQRSTEPVDKPYAPTDLSTQPS